MDAFYVSVELRRRPELRGLPVIVAGSGPRAVVTTASYEARRFGVGSAIPASQARRRCPGGVFLTPDFPYYRETSRQVMGLVRAIGVPAEVIGLDEAYLELSGRSDPRGLMRGLAEQIEHEMQLHCSIGIGPNKLVAKVASDAEKPRGFVLLGREDACVRFAESPCGLVPGIGPKTAGRLAANGIRTLAQLRGADPELLASGFGARLGPELQRRARFEDDSPVTQERKVVSESRETTFDQDILEGAHLQRILERLVSELCATLNAQGRCGRTIGIKVRLDDFSTHTRARTLPHPISSVEEVGRVAGDLLARFGTPRPVRLLGVRVAGLELRGAGRPLQLSLAV